MSAIYLLILQLSDSKSSVQCNASSLITWQLRPVMTHWPIFPFIDCSQLHSGFLSLMKKIIGSSQMHMCTYVQH